ncbi:hypothetical protein DIURU_000941 [Diutina rugosa]|uniref:Protein IBD2 n=1 Tax=Diutina rugosa TaxID=5481 RepID=A0A642UW60_DIURU|nr:uncharacterized protein DIURU_000941 [Diutina rugosa]KAA8906780.1 hypothetical protein DIURU_000941 [Diutina rugosa]
MGDEPTNVVEPQLDPKRLFELVSRNYKSWQEAMARDGASLDSGYPRSGTAAIPDTASETPRDFDGDMGQPILKYNLLELLEKTPGEVDLHALIAKASRDGVDTPPPSASSVPQIAPASSSAPSASIPPPPTNSEPVTLGMTGIPDRVTESILNEQEIDFLRQKISQMINFRPSAASNAATQGGMSLYDTQDERGIVDDDDQDDYDLDELAADEYYKSHHIEVELNSHRHDECTCGDDHAEDGPTCEFTFEYDNSGKLVPTYSNVEEKLRLMGLQHKLGTNGAMKLPSISELNLIDQAAATSSSAHPQSAPSSSSSSKKKKHKKKKKAEQKQAAATNHASSHSQSAPPASSMLAPTDCCLFCEYQFVYGKKPRQMIKWYNQRLRREEQRRQEIKRKIESVKQRAIKRQQHRADAEEPLSHPDDHDDHGDSECYDDDHHHHAESCPHHHHHQGDA